MNTVSSFHIAYHEGSFADDNYFNSRLASKCIVGFFEKLEPLKEKIKKVTFSLENNVLEFRLEGSDKHFLKKNYFPLSLISEAKKINCDYADFSQKFVMCDKINEKANIYFSLAVIADIVQFVFFVVVGVTFPGSWIATLLIMGYPIADGIRAVSHTQRLEICHQMPFLEGMKKRAKINISEASSSFLGGVLFTASKFAEGFQNVALTHKLSLLSIPFYSASYGIDIVNNSFSLYSSHQFEKKIGFKDVDLTQKKQFEETLLYLKSLFCLSDKKIETLISELFVNGSSQEEIQKKYQHFKNEQLLILHELKGTIGEEAFHTLLHDIDEALVDLQQDKLETAKALLEKLQKTSRQQTLISLIKIFVSLVTLVSFILYTLYTAGFFLFI